MPVRAVEAGFFSNLFGAGDQVYADTSAIKLHQPVTNSQNIALLQANVSSVSVLQDPAGKQASNGASKNDNQIDESTSVTVSDNAILPATGPSGISDGKDEIVPPSQETSVYVVRKGDSIAVIAKMFDVSTNTILWANDIKKGDKLVEGDVLLILPISGLEHTVTKGQTLQSIAKLYKADIDEIIQYNDINLDTKLAVGDKIIVPNAEKAEEGDKPVKNTGASAAKDKQYYETHPLLNLTGYFINPVPGYRLSQGLHDKTAVDLAIAKGTPIHASAAGKVILARMGYNGGYGNLVIISHPNGTQTLYAHQSKLATKTGAEVYQGEVIGYIGSTGHSTGPHLHFEVRGARNPGIDASWKY